MKSIVFGLVAVCSLGAHASYMQEYCSNPEGTVQTAEGHSKEHVILTERKWNDSDELVDTKLKFSRAEVKLTFSSDQQVLSSDTHRICDENGAGYGSWERYFYTEVKITKKDHTKFSSHTLNVSEDRTYVSAKVLCKDEGNSLILCDEDEK